MSLLDIVYKRNITVIFFCYSDFSPPEPMTAPTKSEPEREKVRTLKMSVVPCFFLHFSLEKKFLIFPQKPGDRKPLGAHVDSILVAAPLSVHLCDRHFLGSTTHCTVEVGTTFE